MHSYLETIVGDIHFGLGQTKNVCVLGYLKIKKGTVGWKIFLFC